MVADWIVSAVKFLSATENSPRSFGFFHQIHHDLALTFRHPVGKIRPFCGDHPGQLQGARVFFQPGIGAAQAFEQKIAQLFAHAAAGLGGQAA